MVVVVGGGGGGGEDIDYCVSEDIKLQVIYALFYMLVMIIVNYVLCSAWDCIILYVFNDFIVFWL